MKRLIAAPLVNSMFSHAINGPKIIRMPIVAFAFVLVLMAYIVWQMGIKRIIPHRHLVLHEV